MPIGTAMVSRQATSTVMASKFDDVIHTRTPMSSSALADVSQMPEAQAGRMGEAFIPGHL
jgi:hypothetical protein